MQLDIHQLDRKYEGVKVRDRSEESRLRSSLEREGQKQPVVVVRVDGGYVLVDGYRRVRALEKLGRDVVDALVLESGEVEALVTLHHLQHPREHSPLEDGYLVRVLAEEHGLSQGDIARRLGHTQSWVSRRLGLVRDLPEWIQALIRDGEVTCKAATRALLPMARAIRPDAETLAHNLRGLGLSTRQVEELYQAWRSGDERARRLVVESPLLVLHSLEATRDPDWGRPATAATALQQDLGALHALSRRAARRLDRLLLEGPDRESLLRIVHVWREVRAVYEQIDLRIFKETVCHEGPGHAASNPGVAREGDGDAPHREADGSVPQLREEGARLRQ
ncbi:MAG: ParB/RepB/Spo0J family partition protein [Deltaproteobacteria bacterium]|nr:ParB/RepB/Spo0J family partition protein [Deltaproteobacteria bacterium]